MNVVVVALGAEVEDQRRVAEAAQRGRGQQGAVDAVGLALEQHLGGRTVGFLVVAVGGLVEEALGSR